MSDNNEYSDFEFKNIVTELLDERGLKYKINGNQLNGCCPFHEDSNPSFGFNFEKNVYNCFSCEEHGNIVTFVSKLKDISIDEALKMLDYPYLQTEYKYTLKDYADEKNLDVKSLQDWGLETTEHGVLISYYDEMNHYIGARFRHSPNSEPRFSWEKGTKTTLYGLWYLNSLPKKYVILVEGESDCHCAWSHDIIVLGIPGAKNVKKEYAKFLNLFDKIYIHDERRRWS